MNIVIVDTNNIRITSDEHCYCRQRGSSSAEKINLSAIVEF